MNRDGSKPYGAAVCSKLETNHRTGETHFLSIRNATVTIIPNDTAYAQSLFLHSRSEMSSNGVPLKTRLRISKPPATWVKWEKCGTCGETAGGLNVDTESVTLTSSSRVMLLYVMAPLCGLGPSNYYIKVVSIVNIAA